MTTRSIWLVSSSNKLLRADTEIAWDLGFTQPAKREYIKRIASAFEPVKVIDVTSASAQPINRNLSPIFVKVDEVESVEDAWGRFKVTHPEYRQPGVFDFLYLNYLSKEQIAYVLQQEAFSDVFFNPTKASNTQAKSLACLQLLVKQGKPELLRSFTGFVKWYQQECVKPIIWRS